MDRRALLLRGESTMMSRSMAVALLLIGVMVGGLLTSTLGRCPEEADHSHLRGGGGGGGEGPDVETTVHLVDTPPEQVAPSTELVVPLLANHHVNKQGIMRKGVEEKDQLRKVLLATPPTPPPMATKKAAVSEVSRQQGIVDNDVPMMAVARAATLNHVAAPEASAAGLDPGLKGILERFSDYTRVIVRPETTRLIVEVGTNVKPDFYRLARERPEVYLVGLEPVVFDKARSFALQKGKGRIKMFPFAISPENKMTTINVAPITKCSSLLPLVGTGKNCTVLGSTKDVPAITLDALIEHYLPLPTVIENIHTICLDMQGFDLYGLSSLKKATNRQRVANIIYECQDLPVGSSKLISPGALSCQEGLSCISEHWGPSWQFVGCWPNMNVQEYNCVVTNTANPLSDRSVRPTWDSQGAPHTPEHPARCPAYFLKNY